MDIAKTLRESCFCEGRGCELCRAADEINRLRAELAECKQDAEKWRAYEARKRAVIDAGMGKRILRDAARKGEEK